MFLGDKNYEEYDDDFENMDSKKLREILNIKKLILLPDDNIRQRYEIFITLLLLFSAITSPFRIAFYEIDSMSWVIINEIVDIFFTLDIIVNFFFANYDNNEELIHDRKIIAKNYLKSWFVIDVISVLPISIFLQRSNYTSLARIARLPKLYRLIKMTKLARLLKIMKERNNLSRYLNEVLRLNVGLERMAFFSLLFLVSCHITSCFWIIIVNLEDRAPDTWIVRAGCADDPIADQYVAALYYTIVIVTTIGYGDISVMTAIE